MRAAIRFIFLLASISVQADPEIKGTPQDLRNFIHPSPKLVTLQAKVEKTAYADKAVINLLINTEAKLLSEALHKNAALKDQFGERLVEKGIPASQIHSSKFSSSPQYGWIGNQPSSFKVVNRVTVMVNNENHFRFVAEIADSLEGVTLSDTHFEHTKRKESAETLKKEALEKINQQKTLYENSLGVKLSPTTFSESAIGNSPTLGARYLDQALATRSKSGSSSPTVIRNDTFDELKYQMTLSVEFQVSIP